MSEALHGQTVLVIGRGSGIARAVVEAALAAGATVIAAGRDAAKLRKAYDDGPVQVEQVDVTDDASIEALAARLGAIDHLVCTASARARGTIGELERRQVLLSFDTKVVGPLMLAKHLRPRFNDGGSIVLFSGAAAFNIRIGQLAVAITNGAADTLTRSLAVELAPLRVNAVSPGVIDTGAWDGLGEDGKARLFEHIGDTNPVPRVGRAQDVAEAVLFCMTTSYLTGVTLKVDGGEALV